MAEITGYLLWAGVALAVLVGVGLLVWAIYMGMYVKTPPNMAFIRTGWGGRKVVIDGGAAVWFRVHELRWIPLETFKLEILKTNREAFITKDRFRVDIGAEFYVRVTPNEASVERASRSLGDKALDPEAVRELVEEKLVSALRSTAASKTLVVLHENRQGFAQDVAEAVAEHLRENGLSLESVSIFHLDQTRKDMLDPNNVFDAVGLKQIAAVTANEARERNDIERNNEVAITKKNVEAHKHQLEMELDRELATTAQRKNVETDRIARQAETEQSRIAQLETVRRREISRDQQIREAEIQREVYLLKQQEAQEKADVERQTEVLAHRIARERAVRLSEIEREQAIELSKREMEIQLREKERTRAAAEAARLEAEAERERAAQELITVGHQLQAEREKLLALIQATQQEEVAEHQARARERLAVAVQKEGEAQGVARRQVLQAENVRDVKFLYHEVARILAERAPDILRELMEPARHIDSIRILDLAGQNGYGGGGNGSSAVETGPWGKIASHIVSAGMAVPLVKELLEFSSKGQPGEGLKSLMDRFSGLESLLRAPSKAESSAGESAASEPSPADGKRSAAR